MTTPSHTCSAMIRRYQEEWAKDACSPTDDDGYCLELVRNLFRPLHSETLAEFKKGDGGELGAVGRRGKLQALHSSSALACNVFDYWRSVDSDALVQALDLPSPITGMRFEEKFSTGARSRANLDLILHLFDGSLHAIESKFLEPYDATADKTTIQPIYFVRQRWTEVGLPEVQRLASDVRDGRLEVQHLNVAQLLKHMLGLGGQGKPWTLHYLWYDPGGDAGEAQRKEINDFIARLGRDARCFRSMSHNQLFVRLKALAGSNHEQYLKYLDIRYFARVVA